MHGLGILLIILVRLILSADANSNSVLNRPFVVNLVIRAGLVLVGFLALQAGNLVWALVCLVMAFPLVLVNLVFVPAGLPRVTYRFVALTRPLSVSEEPVGGAAFHELRARLRGGRGLAPQATQALAKRLTSLFDGATDRSVRGATVTTRGILDALDGNWVTAREVFDVVQDVRNWHAPRSARAYCQAFLLADAARRGAYHEVVRLAARGPITFRREFSRACATRLLGRQRRSSDTALKLLWLVSPARRAGYSLLKSALAARPRDEIEPTGADLASATAATLRLLRLPRGAATRRELFRVARAWQGVLESGELGSTLVARREALEANFSVRELEATFENDLTELFAELVRDTLAEDPAGEEEPPIITAAKDSLQSELLAELEDLAAELPAGASKRFDGYEKHWHAWAHLRAVARRFLDALPERGAAVYDAVGVTLWNHGSWLHNHEEGVLLANDVFRFLLRIAPQSTEDFESLRQNVAIGDWL